MSFIKDDDKKNNIKHRRTITNMEKIRLQVDVRVFSKMTDQRTPKLKY